MAKPIRALELHLSKDSVFNNVNFTSLFAMELTVFTMLANELLIHIKHYKQLNKNDLWKTVSRTSFQKQSFSRFYNNLLQVCSSAPSFVYAVLHIPSFTVDRLFYFLTPINFVTQPRYSQRSPKKCHEKWSHWRIKKWQTGELCRRFLPFVLHRTHV